MNILQLLVLSIIQGITEWIPVSSEGISVLVILHFGGDVSQALSYAFFFHIGTMLAALLKFKDDIVEMFRSNFKLLKIVFVSTVSTAFTAIPLFYLFKEIESVYFANMIIGVMLILTGISLNVPKSGYKSMNDLGLTDAILLGLVQGIAVIPGISRSGVTVSFLLLRKVRSEHALKLSFIISIPAVAGAIVIGGLPSEISLFTAFLVIVTTLAISYTTIDSLLILARRVNFSKFCISLGLLTVLITGISSLL